MIHFLTQIILGEMNEGTFVYFFFFFGQSRFYVFFAHYYIIMQQAKYQKKLKENRQLLIAYKKVEQLQESCWAQLFRFQKRQFFINFQKKYSVPHVLSLRLDDFIYLFLLIILEIIFGLLPLYSSIYETPYRHSLGLFFITSFMLFISKHWFRWLTLTIICIFYPLLIFCTFKGYINLMPVDTATSIFNYMGYLSLVPIYVFLLIIYPIKEYIRNTIGSFYSYIYGISVTLILYLWPLYSFITSSAFDLTILTSNKPLIISFIVIIITGFYFFIHNTLFQMNLEKIKGLLLQDFTEGELVNALEDFQDDQEPNCIYQHFNLYAKTMSFSLYLLIVGSQIYLYMTLAEDLTKIGYIGPIMTYIIIFILLGAFFLYINVSKEIMTPILMLVSLSSALASFFYYNTSVNFLTYAFISISLPFIAIFWSVINFIPNKQPIFRINAIILCYIMIYIPLMASVLNQYKIFTNDSNLILIINYTIFSIVGIFILLVLIIFIYREVQLRKREFPDEQEKKKVPVDYNYFQQGDPKYEYYTITKELGLGYLQKIDIRVIGYIICMLFFITSMLMTIHAVNELNTTFSTTIFYIESIRQIIYAQFYVNFVFYVYSHVYMINDVENIGISYGFGIYFIAATAVLLFFGAVAGSLNTFFKIIGGFSFIMLLIVIAFEKIKEFSLKLFNFVSPITVTCLWLFVLTPFTQLMPFASLYADQTNIGSFIYTCILISVVLLILLVGILTFIFNKFIDKYEQEKKFKYMIEDVTTLFEEEGVQSRDEELHILYESFIYRDKKYVFFLKRGFPVNLLKDPDDEITKLVDSQDYQLKKVPTKKQLREENEKEKSCLWKFLTCCCGEDDQEIDQKIKKARRKIDPQQLKLLLPSAIMSGLIKQNKFQPKKIKKKALNSGKTFSTKSLLLKNMHAGPRYLSDEYILLKTNKKMDLAIEVWHNVFDFIANTDKEEPLIIQNDFKKFLELSQIQIAPNQSSLLFSDLAKRKWNDTFALDLQSFSFFIEAISQKQYKDRKIPPEQLKYHLLTQKVYYNLCLYEQFNNFIIEQKTTKRLSKSELQKSPFNQSYINYKKIKEQNSLEQQKYVNKLKNHDRNKLLEDNHKIVERNEVERQEVMVQKQRGKSCKVIIYESVTRCKNCCKKQEDKDAFQRKLFVKSWKLLSIEAVKILQRKENQWNSNSQANKEHPFRFSSNNLLIAAFKLLDLYSYISVSILNPNNKWFSNISSSNLFFNYYIQIYIAGAIVLISVPLSIKGIMLIFQDRLGLTQTRLTAKFPHPMYLFTFIYKLLILSLFGIITQTFLSSFCCSWLQSNNNFLLVDDTSIICFSQNHIYYILVSIVCVIIYYPLSSYAFPNFQFAQKSLDLKYRTGYLIFFFQVQFILIANKVLVNGVNRGFTVQIISNLINIAVLSVLGVIVMRLKPCFITWFNYVELLVILIGIVVNVFGLVLYMTDLWLLCVLAAVGSSLIVFIMTMIYIKRNFFQSKDVVVVEQQEKVNQLQMMWMQKQKHEKKIIQYDEKGKKKVNRLNSIVEAEDMT